MKLSVKETERNAQYPVGERHQRKTTRVLIASGPSRLPGRQNG